MPSSDEAVQHKSVIAILNRINSDGWQSRFDLLILRLLGEIEADTFGRKNIELRDRIAALTLQLEAAHRRRDEHADIAQKVFKLSHSLTERWFVAEYEENRQILEMLCLNFSLEGATIATCGASSPCPAACSAPPGPA